MSSSAQSPSIYSPPSETDIRLDIRLSSAGYIPTNIGRTPSRQSASASRRIISSSHALPLPETASTAYLPSAYPLLLSLSALSRKRQYRVQAPPSPDLPQARAQAKASDCRETRDSRNPAIRFPQHAFRCYCRSARDRFPKARPSLPFSAPPLR